MTATKLSALSAKAAATPTRPIVIPATAGPMIRAPLNIAELSATALPMSSRPTISTANDWRTGMSTAFAQPRSRASRMMIGTVTRPVYVRTARMMARRHHHDLDGDQGRALRERVGEHAREQPEHHDRDELGGRDHPEPERVVGQLEDEPGLGDLLHPGADQRDRLAAEEQPVVAMAERGDPAGAHHRRPRFGAVGGASLQLGQARADASLAGAGVLDHRGDPVGLRVEQRDLALDAGERLIEVELPLGRVGRVRQALTVSRSGRPRPRASGRPGRARTPRRRAGS